MGERLQNSPLASSQ